MQDTLFNELMSLVYTTLKLDCPVLSGNMQNHIEYEEVSTNFARIGVSGPSYDFEKWVKTGVIEHTNQYDYAVSVNNVGAFMGRNTRSKHWANRSIVKACRAVAFKYGAEVVVNVEL